MDRRVKTPKKFFSEIVKGVAPAGRLFTKKWKFLIFLGAAFPSPVAIGIGKILHSQVDPRARRPCQV